MTKCFVEDDIDQSLLMPPSLHDWLPENQLARFIADFVRLWQVASRIRRSASAGRAEYGEQQVIGDALLAPGWIVHGQFSDQFLQIGRITRPAMRPRFPFPKETEPFAMPTDHCVRFDDREGIAPVEETR